MTETLPRSAIEPKNPLLNASRSSNLPHVPGIRVGDYIFLSGMGPIDPQTGERNHGSIAEQVRTTLSNMQHMLESAGSSLERVVRVHVVLADILQMAEMDRVYREFFPVDPPARTAWSMQLRFGNGCEIECLALAGGATFPSPVFGEGRVRVLKAGCAERAPPAVPEAGEGKAQFTGT